MDKGKKKREKATRSEKRQQDLRGNSQRYSNRKNKKFEELEREYMLLYGIDHPSKIPYPDFPIQDKKGLSKKKRNRISSRESNERKKLRREFLETQIAEYYNTRDQDAGPSQAHHTLTPQEYASQAIAEYHNTRDQPAGPSQAQHTLTLQEYASQAIAEYYNTRDQDAGPSQAHHTLTLQEYASLAMAEYHNTRDQPAGPSQAHHTLTPQEYASLATAEHHNARDHAGASQAQYTLTPQEYIHSSGWTVVGAPRRNIERRQSPEHKPQQ